MSGRLLLWSRPSSPSSRLLRRLLFSVRPSWRFFAGPFSAAFFFGFGAAFFAAGLVWPPFLLAPALSIGSSSPMISSSSSVSTMLIGSRPIPRLPAETSSVSSSKCPSRNPFHPPLGESLPDVSGPGAAARSFAARAAKPLWCWYRIQLGNVKDSKGGLANCWVKPRIRGVPQESWNQVARDHMRTASGGFLALPALRSCLAHAGVPLSCRRPRFCTGRASRSSADGIDAQEPCPG